MHSIVMHGLYNRIRCEFVSRRFFVLVKVLGNCLALLIAINKNKKVLFFLLSLPNAFSLQEDANIPLRVNEFFSLYIL